MTTISNRPDLTFLQRGAVLLTLCALASCEAFLVSICTFEDRPTCGMTDAVSVPNPNPQNPPDLAAPVIKERTFTLRASLKLDGYHKFTGIIDKKILTIYRKPADGLLSWEAARFDLNNPEPTSRFIPTAITGTPNIPSGSSGFDFFKDDIYTTGGKYYHLQRSGSRKLFELVKDQQIQIMDVILTSSYRPRAFAHPFLNILAVSVGQIPGFSYPTFVFSEGTRYPFDSASAPTSLVVGDLDGNDPTPNGQEIIAFEGAVPTTVSHWDRDQGTSAIDRDLSASLSLFINRASPASINAVDAAFIADINDDQLPDFIYSRSGQIYVTSYLGQGGSINSWFQNWAEKVAVITDDRVKSLVAVELTDDAFPELVVETDKAVHFYVNTP